ncbi:MAG: PhoPQ-activated protein PqaA family protein [Pirellulaceae bacterium]|nr:PhoPQ-activated protein PqaA family protein [Pirellulaceae bacterium]
MARRFLWAALLLVVLAGPSPAREVATGPLADYVAAQDDSYAWTKRTEGQVLSCKYVELTLTSQTWRGIVWKHQLFLLNPASAKPGAKHGLLLIAGGNWRDELADPKAQLKLPGEANLLAAAAELFQTPMAILLHVPQQPIFDGKREDAIIAYTFEEFLKTQDSTWPLLAPMVKSAVKAMDATQEATTKEWGHKLETFTVTGASKRGWTTWLTGAVDRRATAIAPMVIDMLNMVPQVALQKESFGDLSEQVKDYKQRRLDEQMHTARGKALRTIVDPYEYRDQLTQPKLIILGTNDRYWPLDAERNYFGDLRESKYLLRIPNNGHGLQDYGRIVASLNALHQSVITGQPLPKLIWKFDDSADGLSLKVGSDQPISRVRSWTATAKTRDFRDSVWTSADAKADGPGFSCKLARPTEGFAAVFAEMVFEQGKPHEFSFTTSVQIVGSQPAAEGK